VQIYLPNFFSLPIEVVLPKFGGHPECQHGRRQRGMLFGIVAIEIVEIEGN
jgi:hypothetical protein